ncbi:hypothetical protein AaE_002770, partial [Aphanomyces astaci]
MNMPWLHHAKAAATDFVRELWSTDGLLNYLTAKTYFLIVALYQVPSAETWRLQLRELATVERNVNITHSVVDSIGSSVSMCLLPAATPIQERIASDRSEVARAVSSSLNAVRRVRLSRSAFLIELVRTKDIRTNKVLSTSLETKMHRLLRALEQVPSTDSWTHQLEELALDDQCPYDTQAHSVHGIASVTSHLVDAPIPTTNPSEVATAALGEHSDADHDQEDLGRSAQPVELASTTKAMCCLPPRMFGTFSPRFALVI